MLVGFVADTSLSLWDSYRVSTTHYLLLCLLSNSRPRALNPHFSQFDMFASAHMIDSTACCASDTCTVTGYMATLNIAVVAGDASLLGLFFVFTQPSNRKHKKYIHKPNVLGRFWANPWSCTAPPNAAQHQ